MNLTLAIVGSALGLAVTAAAVYTAWIVTQYGKQQGQRPDERAAWTAKLFMSWTVFDLAVVVLFACGTLLLLADLFGVIRDRSGYPLYHYGYLLCGVTFSVMSMLFVLVRLAVVLRAGRAEAEAKRRSSELLDSGGTTPYEHRQP